MAGETNAARKVEAVAAEPKPDGSITIDLMTPVMANGEMIKKIKFRKPTGGDIMALGEGYPININWATGVVMPNPSVMGAIMATLAAVPPSTIRTMDAEDWSTCAFALIRFFPPGGQAMQS